MCFDATGPKDIVDHLFNGYKAKPFESDELARGIEWVLTHENPQELGHRARKKVVESFSSSLIASQYVELYEEILKNN